MCREQGYILATHVSTFPSQGYLPFKKQSRPIGNEMSSFNSICRRVWPKYTRKNLMISSSVVRQHTTIYITWCSYKDSSSETIAHALMTASINEFFYKQIHWNNRISFIFSLSRIVSYETIWYRNLDIYARTPSIILSTESFTAAGFPPPPALSSSRAAWAGPAEGGLPSNGLSSFFPYVESYD